MSGFIPEVEGFELDLERPGCRSRSRTAALDPVISVEFGRSARQRLEAAGNRLLYRESPVGHGIDPAVLPDLRAWLRCRDRAGSVSWHDDRRIAWWA